MTDREREVERREVRLPDGRRLTFYPFPRAGTPGGEAPEPDPGRPTPQAPARER